MIEKALDLYLAEPTKANLLNLHAIVKQTTGKEIECSYKDISEKGATVIMKIPVKANKIPD